MSERVQEQLDPRLRLILDHVAARLVPSDELGPGALESGVGAYAARTLETDGRLREIVEPGLRKLDAYSQKVSGAGFATVDAEAQDSTLAALEDGTIEGGSASFEAVLQLVREGMFGDPRWGGNADGAGWTLLGYPGPRHVWTADDQAVEE